MKIAITGVKGMLGSELALRAAAAGHEVVGYDLPELNITCEISRGALDEEVDLLVNCAAYTDVDRAESDRAAAFAVNCSGAGRLAVWCHEAGVRMVHISTDYVFDGTLSRPYLEEDEEHPLSVYGDSKLAGERAVQAVQPDTLIVRTQALFGPRGKSFPAAIIAKLDEGAVPLRVVNDQKVCPTCTGHLADDVLELAGVGASGIVHVSSSGECTWYQLACEIADRIRPGTRIDPVTTAEVPRPAVRPACSVLSKAKCEKLLGRAMPDWKAALAWYLESVGRG